MRVREHANCLMMTRAEQGMTINTSEERFFNREISWLNFNRRVLEEAANKSHPLLERVRFLSISASNLDEFYMVRYAGLRGQVSAGITKTSTDGLSPTQQVSEIEDVAGQLMKDQQAQLRKLKKEMHAAGIEITAVADLKKTDLTWLRQEFDQHIFPLLTPLAVDAAHPFPFLQNLGFAIAVDMQSDSGDHLTALVPIPEGTPRFVRLPGKPKDPTRYVMLEDVIGLCLDKLFPGFEEKGLCCFRVVRDSDIEIEEDAEDLIVEFENLLNRRRRGRIVRIMMTRGAPRHLKTVILQGLKADASDVVLINGMLGMAQLSELIIPERADLQFPYYEPRYPERIREHGGNCFTAIAEKDILVHHPYESFDVVAEFLRQAAEDPDVITIKQTLYRTTPNSPIVAALIEAAESGKNVTALVEIKARFDEETNLKLARDLERAGVQVVYGFIEYKTHAKVSLVIRREHGELVAYTHFGTGNYHPITAKVYTDLSLFTANPVLGRDAGKLLNFVTAYSEPPETGPELETLAMSPTSLRSTLMDHIEGEMQNARDGKPCGIWAKMNSLVDKEIIDTLYKASCEGVPITLIVRGICCLRPGVPGLSENIRVKSIVGRFLEHSRIACFANGYEFTDRRNKVFISSADWMPRNLNRRVESFVPIENDTVHRQVLSQIMVANLNDDQQSWELRSDGSYQRSTPAKGGGFTAHNYFMDYPSLSGRGSALQLGPPPKLKRRKRAQKETPE